jgi:hypothetical protein
MFAGNDARLFGPYVDKVIWRLRRLKERGEDLGILEVKKEAMEAYQELFDDEFSAGFLSRLRIPNIAEFRKNGFAELGPDVHREV